MPDTHRILADEDGQSCFELLKEHSVFMCIAAKDAEW